MTNNIWKEEINNIFNLRNKQQLSNILNIILGIDEKNTDMIELYNLVGLDIFNKIVNYFDGKYLKILKKETLKEDLLLCILYYYREIEHKSWEYIHKEIPFEFNPISYGMKIKNFNDNIKEKIKEYFLKEENKNE